MAKIAPTRACNEEWITLIDLNIAASVNYHFFGSINSYVYLIEVNNCIIYSPKQHEFLHVYICF